MLYSGVQSHGVRATVTGYNQNDIAFMLNLGLLLILLLWGGIRRDRSVIKWLFLSAIIGLIFDKLFGNGITLSFYYSGSGCCYINDV